MTVGAYVTNAIFKIVSFFSNLTAWWLLDTSSSMLFSNEASFLSDFVEMENIGYFLLLNLMCSPVISDRLVVISDAVRWDW